MSDNIKEQKEIVELEDVKSAAFYFFAVFWATYLRIWHKRNNKSPRRGFYFISFCF
ncbi:hypothetical protein K2466_004327 [Salmonella enterica]|nr:hypothetical protein [Salmonella enterica]